MKRLCIICEGQTELGFVKELLVPHLQTFGIDAYATPLTRGPKQQRGGNVSVSGLGRHIRNAYHNVRFITTLVDYYGFKNIKGRSKKQLEQDILNQSQSLIGQRFNAHYVRPYVQMYEFEALLFSDISRFKLLGGSWNNKSQTRLQRICDGFKTPEDINDSAQTAPSKRLDAIFPGYGKNKTLYGPLIAEAIGLAKIRQACPLFNNWIDQLEKL